MRGSNTNFDFWRIVKRQYLRGMKIRNPNSSVDCLLLLIL